MYSKEQSEALKEAFLRTEYLSYGAHVRLAARLHLDEHRVQVRAPPPAPGRPSSRPGRRWGPRGQRGQGCPGPAASKGPSLWTQGWAPVPLNPGLDNPGLDHPANRIRPA